jgi:Ca-activated chloride channel family protein
MMEALSQFHFIRPFWLLLAVPGVGLWWWWRRSADPLRGWREQMDPALLEALATGRDRRGQWGDTVLLVAWLIAVAVIAGPTWKPEPSPFAEDASPLVVLLKADASMEKDDVAPSRLQRAQLKIADLTKARKGQPLGLIAYAGSAHLVLPPTKDTAIVAQMAAEISPRIMPEPGDHLELALAKAGELLAERKTAGSILVIADAVDGDLEAITEAHREQGSPPVDFLAVNIPGSSEDEALRKAASALSGRVEPLTVDDADINAIVQAAAHPPVSRSAIDDNGTRWQEGGWYLVPIITLLAALAFRRETAKSEQSAA